MRSTPLEIICRCIAAIVLSAGIYYAAINWPDPLVWLFLLGCYVGVVFMTLRDMVIFRLGAFSWFIMTPRTISGFVMWVFFAFILALLGTVIIPLRLLWNILRLLAASGGGPSFPTPEPPVKTTPEPPQIQPAPPRVYTPPATTNPPAHKQDADKKGEQKPKEEKETIRILHLHGDLGKLTLVPTDGKKPHTVGKLQLRACSAKAEQAELIQCIIQSDASSKGLLWTVTPVGSQNVLLHNGEPMPQQVPFALLGGHRLSIAPAQTPRIPFLTLTAQIETAVKTVSHNR